MVTYKFKNEHVCVFISRSVFLLYSFMDVADEIVVGRYTSNFVFDEELFEEWFECVFVMNHAYVVVCSISVAADLVDDGIHAHSEIVVC